MKFALFFHSLFSALDTARLSVMDLMEFALEFIISAVKYYIIILPSRTAQMVTDGVRKRTEATNEQQQSCNRRVSALEKVSHFIC